jgi:hypothetical protein
MSTTQYASDNHINKHGYGIWGTARNYFLLAVMFACVRDECVFCPVLYLPGHVDQVIEASKVRVVIDNCLRLLVCNSISSWFARTRYGEHEIGAKLLPNLDGTPTQDTKR